MNLSAIGTVSHEAYTPGAANALGLRPDAWAAPADVDIFGWWPPTAEQILGVEPGRRATEIERAMLVPVGTVCGDRDRWTESGGVAFEQVAGPQDFNHGPFGATVPLIVYLKRVSG